MIKKQYLDSTYLNFCLNTERQKEWCKRVKTDGVSQSNINAQILSAFTIPLPPLPEQQEIVRRVEKLFARADSIKEKYQNAAQYIEKLEQALLAKAFRGELAEADANDESAEALLERIRAGKGK
jgi:type I restriction enzyme S subunit